MIRDARSASRTSKSVDPTGSGVICLDPRTMTPSEIYKVMTGIVVPRPIAWVTTRSRQGCTNLAPFSSFTFVSHSPPMLAIGIDAKPNGAGLKDTARNIVDTSEFVVHIADHSLLSPLHASAREYPVGTSEIDALGLATVPSSHIEAPRLRDAPIAVECRLHRCIELGEGPTRLMIGDVLCFHVRDSLLDAGKIDTALLDPISRLAGSNYAAVGRITPR